MRIQVRFQPRTLLPREPLPRTGHLRPDWNQPADEPETEDHVQRRAYTIAFWAAPLTLAMIGAVSLWTPFLNPLYAARWFGWPHILLAIPVPLMVIAAAYVLLKGLIERRETSPFLAALSLFVLSFIGIGISFFPNIVPHSVTIWDAAAPDNSLSFLLVGAVVLVPLILAYTAYSYWVFRGKGKAVGGYH